MTNLNGSHGPGNPHGTVACQQCGADISTVERTCAVCGAADTDVATNGAATSRRRRLGGTVWMPETGARSSPAVETAAAPTTANGAGSHRRRLGNAATKLAANGARPALSPSPSLVPTPHAAEDEAEPEPHTAVDPAAPDAATAATAAAPIPSARPRRRRRRGAWYRRRSSPTPPGATIPFPPGSRSAPGPPARPSAPSPPPRARTRRLTTAASTG